MDRNSASRISKQIENVALRKESVDRNLSLLVKLRTWKMSLSARRAWIEIQILRTVFEMLKRRSPQGERG